MTDKVIEVNNICKKFCRTLKRSMYYGVTDSLTSALGFQKKRNYLRKDEFWALKNVNFSLKKGEALGVIGKNGSGKTTLLKLLSGIFPPDEGFISIKGKLGALIAVGAGFHPHMTGRENIFLNGTLLGMKRAEIKNRFESIVEFAEIGNFIDAPVATYSSGMRVRLGFAIASEIQLDILLVDEILAVGDAQFRTKAINKMMKRIESTSVIFVSHTMEHIARISTRVLVMEDGKAIIYEEPQNAINDYLGKLAHHQKNKEWFDGNNHLGNIYIKQTENDSSKYITNKINNLDYGRPFQIIIEAFIDPQHVELEFNIQFIDSELNTVLLSNSAVQNQTIRNPNSPFTVLVDFDKLILFPGKFYLNITVMDICTKKILARKWYSTEFVVAGDCRGGRFARIDGKWRVCLDSNTCKSA